MTRGFSTKKIVWREGVAIPLADPSTYLTSISMIQASFFLFVGTLFVTAVSLPIPMKLSDGSLGGREGEFCKLCQVR